MWFLLLGCLSSKNVTKLRVSDGPVLRLCPGEVHQLQINARLKDGSRRRTGARGKEKLPWRELVVRFDGHEVDRGVIAMPSDPRDTLGQSLPLRVYLADRGEISWKGSVQPRYDCDYWADYSGRAGADGDRYGGTQADDGEDGFDRFEGGRGGPGGQGENGTDGGHGDHGGHGRHVELSWTMTEIDGQPMIAARTQGMRRREPVMYFLIEPGHGSLAVDVRGGRGGDGEDGQDGGDGGDGGEGNPVGPGGDAGWGGDGGDGGNGGDAGLVVVTSSEDAERYLGAVHIDNLGGAAGVGGDPGEGGWGGDGNPAGAGGRDGRPGRDGQPGQHGVPPEVFIDADLPTAW